MYYVIATMGKIQKFSLERFDGNLLFSVEDIKDKRKINGCSIESTGGSAQFVTVEVQGATFIEEFKNDSYDCFQVILNFMNSLDKSLEFVVTKAEYGKGTVVKISGILQMKRNS